MAFSTCVFPALLALPLAQGAASTVVSFGDFQGEPGISATIGGKAVKLVLATRWADSYLVGAKETAAKPVMVGKKALVAVPFIALPKGEAFPGAQGVLGMDALKKLCFAVDPLYSKIEFLPRPKIGLEGAKAYFAKLPPVAGAQVVRLALGRSLRGDPLVKTNLEAQKINLIFSLGPHSTYFGPTVKAPRQPVGKRVWMYQPRVVFPGLSPRWMGYSTYAQWSPSQEGAHGIVALDAYGSRRVLVDLADSAIYVEELPEDAQLSMFFSNRVRIPIIVSGEGAVLDAVPGNYEGDVGPMKGFKIVRIAEIPIAEWIKDLRLGSSEAAARLSRRLNLLYSDFDIVVVGPDGEEETIPMPADGGPGETLSR